MGKKYRWVLIVAAAACLTMFGLAIFFGLRSRDDRLYSEQIAKAKSFFDAGDYEAAITEYQKAIDMDNKKKSAYSGLANVYYSMGKLAEAKAVLQEGKQNNGSEDLQILLNQVSDDIERFGEDTHGWADIDTDPQGQTKEKPGSDAAALDLILMQMYSGSSYGDYKRNHQVESSSIQGDGSVKTRFSGISADFYFASTELQPNAVINGQIAENSVPVRIVLDKPLSLFGGLSNLLYEQLNMQPVGDLRVLQDAAGNHYLQFTYDSMTVEIACSPQGDILEEEVWNELHPQEPDLRVSESENTLTVLTGGRCINAQTGLGIGDIRLQFREGASQVGTVVAEVVTDGNGDYEVELESGMYTVEISGDGFTTSYQELYLGTYQTSATQDFFLSAELNEGEIRIVLTWDSTPRDLDSYLFGYPDAGGSYVTSFRNYRAYHNGVTLAELDLDDTDGYGPETTTIYDTNGVFTFKVHDFRHELDIGMSGAVVTVYMPGESPVDIAIDSRMTGCLWNVFTIDHGRLIINNTQEEPDHTSFDK